MNESSAMLLIGIGTSGCAMARKVNRAFGEGLRYLLLDTDATTGNGPDPFLLLGGDRLSGHGTGGDVVTARLAAEDSINVLDDSITSVRLAVIVTALGGGTGGGATLEAIKHLSSRGIPSIVFATTPFECEGEVRRINATSVMSLIEEEANASFFIPLDKLIGDVDNMAEALRRGVDTLSSAVTLFWRLVEKPGYIRLDTERIRHLIARAGRGRFATVVCQGPNRSVEVVDALTRAPLLTEGKGLVRSILCGVLAGEDLRLSEVGKIADGLKAAFCSSSATDGNQTSFELATVNDEETFTGRLATVVMLFEENGRETQVASIADHSATPSVIGVAKKSHKTRSLLKTGPTGRGRFNNAQPTIWNGEDLDVPTFLRRNINLDF